MTVYADSSFYVSIYVEDARSKVAEQLLHSGVAVWFTPLHYAEYAHALSQQVFFKNLTAADAEKAYRDLDSDRASGLWVEVEMPQNVFDLCAELARKYGPKLGVRTLDSLHVACALELKAERFWTFDERQAKLARAEGLKIS